VDELPGIRALRDARRMDREEHAELAELRARYDASLFDDHSGTPTAKV
jgi:hypothetical protein